MRLAEAAACLRVGILPFDLTFDFVTGYDLNWSKEDAERVAAIVRTLPPVPHDICLDNVTAFVEDPDGVRYAHETRNSAGMHANQRHAHMTAMVHEELKDAIRLADQEAGVRFAAAVEAYNAEQTKSASEAR